MLLTSHEELPAEVSSRLLAAGRRRRFDRREVIFHEGDAADSLHLIVKGDVAIRTTTSVGAVVTIDVIGVGDLLGELAILPPVEPRSATAVALQPTETIAVPATVFHSLRQELPVLTELVLAILTRRTRQVTLRMAEAVSVPVDVRVLRRLAELASRSGDREGDVVVSLTQDDLAGLAATTRETVNRVLRAEEERGVLALGRGRITVLDHAALVRAAR